MLSKPELRTQLRQRRAAIPAAQARKAAIRAAAHIAGIPRFARARRVAIYLEQGSELATWPLLHWLWQRGREVYVPRVAPTGTLRFVRFTPDGALRINRHGIREPAGGLRRGARALDAIVLPLTGFDAHGHRLGSGAGYYDRTLALHRPFKKPLLIGYAHAAQQVDALPVDAWDVRLDCIVTERGVLRWPTG